MQKSLFSVLGAFAPGLLTLALSAAGCDQGAVAADPYRPQDEHVLEQTTAVDAGAPVATSTSRIGAMGIVVSDLKKSTDFYTRVLGMKQTATYTLDNMDEVVVAFDNPRGSAIVLMQYKDGTTFDFDSQKKKTKKPMLKIVTYVADAKATTTAIAAAGYEITREAAPSAVLNNTILGFAKDPDGYDLEIIQTP